MTFRSPRCPACGQPSSVPGSSEAEPGGKARCQPDCELEGTGGQDPSFRPASVTGSGAAAPDLCGELEGPREPQTPSPATSGPTSGLLGGRVTRRDPGGEGWRSAGSIVTRPHCPNTGETAQVDCVRTGLQGAGPEHAVRLLPQEALTACLSLSLVSVSGAQ